MNNLVVVCTDFGLEGPYVGLLKHALLQHGPRLQVIDLCHDMAAFDAQASAYLLAALAKEFAKNTVFLGVVDPGVGGHRAGLIVKADDQWFVGPDNGLFDRVGARAEVLEAWHITWQPTRLSASFHGRDLFAPVAAMLASRAALPQTLGAEVELALRSWPDELARVVYVDRYGNAMTGIRASAVKPETRISIDGQTVSRARTFSDVPPGQGFWYENSIGLVELAVNQGSAAGCYKLTAGVAVKILREATDPD